MFLVFNKSKIYSYIIALSTVTILFVAVAKMDNMISPTNSMVETSANSIENNQILNEVVQNAIENIVKE